MSEPGSHDYESEGFSVERVEDARRVAHPTKWADEPVGIFPGCRTEKDGGRRYLVVSGSACPVRALHVRWFQYTGSHPDHSHSWRKETWCRFEIDSGDEG